MAFLKVTSGEMKGTKFQIDRDEVIIGRIPENVVHLDDPSVSGRHCAIRRVGRRFTLTDFKSTNGTRLNDVRVETYRLSAKDRISVGSVELIFDGDDIEDAHPTQIPPTIVRHAVRTPQAENVTSAPSFEKRHSVKGLWVGLSILFGLLTACAFVWLVLCLFKS